MFANSTSFPLPPLPSYTLTARDPLLSFIPDNLLVLACPVIAYWVVSMFFHWLDVNDYFSNYRLHTPAEVLKRNHVSRWDVIKDVIIQHIIQTLAGATLSYFDGDEYVGREDYDVAVWATRIRLVQRIIPKLLSVLGFDTVGIAGSLSSYPILGAVISGGNYPFLSQQVVSESGAVATVPAFAHWELQAASAIYWYLIPAFQFLFATFFVDTWQYFLHRAMHLNKWLYSKLHLLYEHPLHYYAVY